MMPMNHNLERLQRSGIRVFTNLARQTAGCRMLTIGEPDLDTPREIREAAARAMEAGQTHYAPNQGTESLRRAIAAFETRRGRRTEAGEVLVTVGATQALNTALTGILNPGDEVIIPTPAFSLYDSIVTAAGAKSVFLDVSKTGFQITKEALDVCLTERTRAIVLNSPNNPTGVVLKESSLEAVAEAVRQRDIYLICDNVYGALSYVNCPDLTWRRTFGIRPSFARAFPNPMP